MQIPVAVEPTAQGQFARRACHLFRPLQRACRAFGYRMPVICTPEELKSGDPMKLDSVLAEIRATREAFPSVFTATSTPCWRIYASGKRKAGESGPPCSEAMTAEEIAVPPIVVPP